MSRWDILPQLCSSKWWYWPAALTSLRSVTNAELRALHLPNQSLIFNKTCRIHIHFKVWEVFLYRTWDWRRDWSRGRIVSSSPGSHVSVFSGPGTVLLHSFYCEANIVFYEANNTLSKYCIKQMLYFSGYQLPLPVAETNFSPLFPHPNLLSSWGEYAKQFLGSSGWERKGRRHP